MMKNMQKNHQQRRSASGKRQRVSLVDFLIVLLAVLSVAGLVARWVIDTVKTEKNYVGEAHKVTYQILETRTETLDSLRLRDQVYLLEDGGYIGYMEAKPQVISAVGRSDRATATGVLICEGEMEDDSLLIRKSGICLTPGMQIELRTERARLTIVITGIES